MRQTQENFYSDLDLTFNTHPLNSDISILFDENSIEQNMYNVLMANNGDAKFHPEKCLGIRDMLFEPINIITEEQLRIKIKDILDAWMPRIEVLRIDVDSIRDEGYRITISYVTINIVNEQQSVLFLDRIR